jgi:hypothetical protein
MLIPGGFKPSPGPPAMVQFFSSNNNQQIELMGLGKFRNLKIESAGFSQTFQ